MIHKTAIISKSAEIGAGVKIGPYSVIGDNVKIGDETIVDSHVVIEGPTTIGRGCRIFHFCSLGAIPQDLKFKDEDSELIIGNNNTFREYVTINRGTQGGGGKTVLEDNIFLMACSHVAHDCHISNNVIIANGSSLAGHIHIEENAILGGMVGVHQFARVGAHVMIGGLSGASKDVPPYTIAVGQRATLRGLNLNGLKRHKFPGDTISELKTAYRIFFRMGMTVNKAVEKIKEEGLNSPEARHLTDFIQNSKRGIIRE